jgi:hypothetical protein
VQRAASRRANLKIKVLEYEKNWTPKIDLKFAGIQEIAIPFQMFFCHSVTFSRALLVFYFTLSLLK